MQGNKKIWYSLGLDNESLKKDSNKSKQLLHGISNKAVTEGKRMDDVYKKLSRTIGTVFSVAALTGFIRKLALTRGEFQQLEVAFRTMLGSKQKADALMTRTVEFAAKTPFDLQGVASGTKQLLAYGSEAETVTDELNMLGNIASGLSIPLGDIVYLYGTTRTQGRLFTRDLRQFMGRGIPLAEELAKKFKVTKDEVGGLVTAGKVGFKDVEEAMRNMTAEGGKFYNLMEEQSKTITGKISNLGDALSQMFNKIGQSQEGTIGTALDQTIELTSNYEEVGKTIIELIATYGVYKAALMTITAVNKIKNTVTVFDIATKRVNIALTKQQTKALIAQRIAQIKANASMLANPYVAVAAAIAALGYGVYKYATYLTEAEKAQIKLNKHFDKASKSIRAEELALNSLYGKLKSAKKGTDEYKDTKKKILLQYGDYLSALDKENIALGKVEKAYDNILVKMRQKYREEAMNNAISEANKIYADKEVESLKKIRDAFVKKFNDKKGKEIYFSILPKIQGGEKLAGEYSKIVEEFTKTSYAPSTQIGQKGTKFYSNSIKTYIKDIQDAQKVLNQVKVDAKDKVEGLFGPEKKTTKDKEELQSISTILKQIADLETKISVLRQKSITGLTKKEVGNLVEYQKSISTLKNTLLSFGVAKKKVSEYDVLKTQKDDAKKLEDLTYESELKKLQMKKDSAQKSLDIIKLENARKMQLLKRQEKEAFSKIESDRKADKQANPKTFKKTEWTNKAILYRQIWDKIIVEQIASNNKATDNFIQEQLSKYLTYTEKVSKLKLDAENQIKFYTDLGKREGNKDKYAEKIKLIREELQKLLIEAGKTSNTSILSKLFGDNTYSAVAEMQDIVDESEKMYKALVDSGASKTELKAVREQIDLLKESIRGIETGFGKMKEGLKEVFSGKYDKGDITTSISKINEGFAKASKYVSFFSDSLMSLGDSFDSQSLKDISTTINNVMDVTSKTIEGAKLGAELAGPIGAAVGASIALATSLAKIFAAKHDKKLEEKIAIIQLQVDTLKRTYDELGKSIDKAYSTDASRLIQQQDENLRQQKRLLEQQILDERKKKHSDEEKIKGWQDAIYQIDQTLAETEARQIEAINGQGVNEAISQFADAYIQAWSAGEDKAKSMKDVVRAMIKSAIAELVKSRMSGEVEAFSAYLASAMEDGILTVAEQNVLDQLEAAINDKMNGLSNTLDQYVVDPNARQAATKGFASMSQDSADELNGRFAVIQGHTYQISEGMLALKAMSQKQLAHLANIDTNTFKLNKIENDIALMKSGIDDINTIGIKLR